MEQKELLKLINDETIVIKPVDKGGGGGGGVVIISTGHYQSIISIGIYRRNELSSERANKYLQKTYKATAISTIGS